MAERLSTALANLQLADFANTFKNGVLAIYSGNQPASADAAETGTLLCLITRDGGAFTPGQPANGLNFGKPADGRLDKASDETWSGNVLADGVAGWFRFYDNSYTTGASTRAKRFDGTVAAISSAEMFLNDTQLYANTIVAVDNFPILYQAD